MTPFIFSLKQGFSILLYEIDVVLGCPGTVRCSASSPTFTKEMLENVPKRKDKSWGYCNFIPDSDPITTEVLNTEVRFGFIFYFTNVYYSVES
jgi:hypothetical protein